MKTLKTIFIIFAIAVGWSLKVDTNTWLKSWYLFDHGKFVEEQRDLLKFLTLSELKKGHIIYYPWHAETYKKARLEGEFNIFEGQSPKIQIEGLDNINQAEGDYTITVKSNLWWITGASLLLGDKSRLTLHSKNVDQSFIVVIFTPHTEIGRPNNIRFGRTDLTLKKRIQSYQVHCEKGCQFENLSSQTLMVRIFENLPNRVGIHDLCGPIWTHIEDSEWNLKKPDKKVRVWIPSIGDWLSAVRSLVGIYNEKAHLLAHFYPEVFKKIEKRNWLEKNYCSIHYINYITNDEQVWREPLRSCNTKILISKESRFEEWKDVDYKTWILKNPVRRGLRRNADFWGDYPIFFKRGKDGIYRGMVFQFPDAKGKYWDIRSQIDPSGVWTAWWGYGSLIKEKPGNRDFRIRRMTDYEELVKKMNQRKIQESLHLFRGVLGQNHKQWVRFKGLKPLFCCYNQKGKWGHLENEGYWTLENPSQTYLQFSCVLEGDLREAMIIYRSLGKSFSLGQNEIQGEGQLKGVDIYRILTGYSNLQDKREGIWRSEFMMYDTLCDQHGAVLLELPHHTDEVKISKKTVENRLDRVQISRE